MSSTGDAISDAMQDALTDGPTGEPVALLSLIREIGDPFVALSDRDKGHELFGALYQDIPLFQIARQTRRPLSAAEHDRLVCLLRWLISALRTWRATNDPRGSELAALFVAAQACDWDNALWNMLPADIGNNGALISRLQEMISSFAVTVASRDPARTPLWEHEAVESLKAAEAKNDWVAIGREWLPFSNALLPNALQTQAVRCLYRCGVGRLTNALTNVSQTAVGMVVARAVSTTQKLDLAVTSDNPYVQFCCLYQALSDHRSLTKPLSTEQEQLLAKLLLKVANDSPRWTAWMQVFNAYPIRYPALQTSLGTALADAPEAATEAYVKSIVLSPQEHSNDAGRLAVATCLRAFRSKASPTRTAELWSLAYERWTKWEFNRADRDQHLSKINWCELDYAIVGYACECLDAEGRRAAIDLIAGKLQVIEESWCESSTVIMTAWNRLLSAFQPYAHAQNVISSGEDWLSIRRQYFPFDPAHNEYTMLRYRF